MNHRIIVAGTGRSGTGYAAALLNWMGLRVGHEAVYDHDEATSGTPNRWGSWHGDSSLAAWAYLDRLDRPARVVVVSRPHRQVVASLLGSYFFADTCPCHAPGEHLTAPYARWIAEHLPGVLDEPTEMRRTIAYVKASYEKCLAMAEHPNVEAFQRIPVATLSHVGDVVDLYRFLTLDDPSLTLAQEALTVSSRNNHAPHPTRAELIDALLSTSWVPTL